MRDYNPQKTDATEIIVLLDRSASMRSIKQDVIDGFNDFLAEQRAVPGQALVTGIQFDHDFDVVCQQVPVERRSLNLNNQKYRPRGSTALLDAMGRTLSTLFSQNPPSKAVILVYTDGQENSSTKYSFSEVKTLVQKAQDWGWKVIFGASGLDAISQASSLGVSSDFQIQTDGTGAGMRQFYSTSSGMVTNYRTNSSDSGDTNGE